VADALVGVGLICNSENMPGVLMLDKDYNNMSKFLNRYVCVRMHACVRACMWVRERLHDIGLCFQDPGHASRPAE
jgi:hypothetical protein